MLRGTLGGFATGVNVKTVPDTFSNPCWLPIVADRSVDPYFRAAAY
jgi:hypothetical protein